MLEQIEELFWWREIVQPVKTVEKTDVPEKTQTAERSWSRRRYEHTHVHMTPVQV